MNDDLPWYIRSKRGQMKTFGLVVLVCLISWAALMVSIVFIDQALVAPCMQIDMLENRVSQLESEVDVMNQIMMYL